MTAMMLGVPALALSQAFTKRDAVPWDTARTLGAETIRKLWAIGWGKSAVLNINFPPIPAAEAGPMTLARQGEGAVAGMHVDTRVDPRGMSYYWLNFRRGDIEQGPESDYRAMRAGKIVVPRCATIGPMTRLTPNWRRICPALAPNGAHAILVLV